MRRKEGLDPSFFIVKKVKNRLEIGFIFLIRDIVYFTHKVRAMIRFKRTHKKPFKEISFNDHRILSMYDRLIKDPSVKKIKCILNEVKPVVKESGRHDGYTLQPLGEGIIYKALGALMFELSEAVKLEKNKNYALTFSCYVYTEEKKERVNGVEILREQDKK